LNRPGLNTRKAIARPATTKLSRQNASTSEGSSYALLRWLIKIPVKERETVAASPVKYPRDVLRVETAMRS